jgi:hypothetical protein
MAPSLSTGDQEKASNQPFQVTAPSLALPDADRRADELLSPPQSGGRGEVGGAAVSASSCPCAQITNGVRIPKMKSGVKYGRLCCLA